MGRPGAFERGGLSGRGSSKASPLVERWSWVWRARSCSPQCLRHHCFDPSPMGALVHLVIRCRLCRPIPVACPGWPDWQPVIHLRITTVIPQRWPTSARPSASPPFTSSTNCRAARSGRCSSVNCVSGCPSPSQHRPELSPSSGRQPCPGRVLGPKHRQPVAPGQKQRKQALGGHCCGGGPGCQGFGEEAEVDKTDRTGPDADR